MKYLIHHNVTHEVRVLYRGRSDVDPREFGEPHPTLPHGYIEFEYQHISRMTRWCSHLADNLRPSVRMRFSTDHDVSNHGMLHHFCFKVHCGPHDALSSDAMAYRHLYRHRRRYV